MNREQRLWRGEVGGGWYLYYSSRSILLYSTRVLEGNGKCQTRGEKGHTHTHRRSNKHWSLSFCFVILCRRVASSGTVQYGELELGILFFREWFTSVFSLLRLVFTDNWANRRRQTDLSGQTNSSEGGGAKETNCLSCDSSWRDVTRRGERKGIQKCLHLVGWMVGQQ